MKIQKIKNDKIWLVRSFVNGGPQGTTAGPFTKSAHTRVAKIRELSVDKMEIA